MKQNNISDTLAETFAKSADIDYQLKTAELFKEQMFLQKYTPLDTTKIQSEQDELEEK